MDLKYFLKGNKKEKKTTKYAPTKSLCDENGKPVEFTIKAIKEMIDNPAEYDDFAVFVQSYNGFDISLSEKVEQAKNS